MRRKLSAGLLVTAAVAVAQQRAFVSCPIVRDTRTVPCYLAEYEGELYFLGVQQDGNSEFRAPQLKHEVLVEGTVAPGPRICGGIPLQPVSISVLKEVNLNCNTLLPAEAGIDAPPARASVPAAGTYSGAHEFDVVFSFNDDSLDFGATQVLNEAAAYAKRPGAASVKVSGMRGATTLSNGERLVEKSGLAEKRAQNVAALLRGLGVTNVTANWKTDAEAGNSRRAAIVVSP